MVHPDVEVRFINEEVGFGLVATKLLPKGTITWIGDDLDLRVSPARYKKFDELYKNFFIRYAYRDEKGNYVLDWHIGRFTNHSFNPNSISTAYDFDLAVRDILPGEEVTEDYGFLNLTEDDIFAPVPEAGADQRPEVRPEDFLQHYQKWDAQLAEAFKFFAKVDQPLHKYIRPKYRRLVAQVAAGKRPVDSILNTSVHQGKEIKHLTTLRDRQKKKRTGKKKK